MKSNDHIVRLPTRGRIISLLTKSADSTTIPSTLFRPGDKQNSNDNKGSQRKFVNEVSYTSDLISKRDLNVEDYISFTSKRHRDCSDLLDRYQTETVRCGNISQDTFNIRWKASWVSSGSLWLYDLAGLFGWDVETKVPDSSRRSTFSWISVVNLFSNAFSSGTITLPVNEIKGNTRISLDSRGSCFSIGDSIDLILEADKGRLENRLVAQELASWLDISRRPPGFDKDDWAASIRQRILANTPGAGVLDIDPNEENEAVPAFVVFGMLSLLCFSFINQVLLNEVVGGNGSVSQMCEDSAKLEIGSGYLSECFGPYGDGPFLK